MKKKKILLLGSGALKIGQAGEFDYSGSQAIKAFKEEGHEVILINPNIATYQTTFKLSDRVYFLPVNEYFVEEIIKKEKVNAIALSFGGQTALNTALSLEENGVFAKYGVEVLGTSVRSISLSEDRKLFANHLHKINISTPKSVAATSIKQAQAAAQKIGFPIMMRVAYALGGQRSGVIHTARELDDRLKEAFAFAPQVLIEQYLHHYKEIEYEIVRDKYDNCVSICNMENFDPLGIHTGESIVVAPSQTLTNEEYHRLREISIKIVRSLDIIGECNVQFALNPHPPDPNKMDYYVIELNPRLSRSSALASKATGYPLAYIAAKLILGKSLTEIDNQVTKVTQACFEPALDYLVVKIPRWDLDKFRGVEQTIGSSMKSVGEVMSIGRKFEEALQKAVRMLDIGVHGILNGHFDPSNDDYLEYLEKPTTKRLFAIAEGIRRGTTLEKIHDITGIDMWFLYRIKHIVDVQQELVANPTLANDKNHMRALKEVGIADARIAELIGKTEIEVRKLRKEMDITPSVFQIDTLAGEIPAMTNYLYMTYNGGHHDVEPVGRRGVVVLGSGPYRIGSSVEFDWTCVNTAIALKTHHRKSIIVNCNPETVSTDYDMSDRLYFEQLTFERIADIFEFENPEGIIVSVGGQTPNNIVGSLERYEVPILGTLASDIDRVEDRSKFSSLCDKLGLEQPAWTKVETMEHAIEFADEVGYPVLIRPSYVLSGAAMNVCNNEEELVNYVEKATLISSEYPITVSKFMIDAKEIEFDAVAQDGEIMIHALSEHVENAGVHSGDATIMFPPQKIYLLTEQKILEAARKLAHELNITGPFNIQFLGIRNRIFIIEMNARASRTFPFISRATSRNFAKMIVDAIYRKARPRDIIFPEDHVLVKAAQFSFSRLAGADPVLSVEMSSTGEAACFGEDVEEAFYKATLSVGEKTPVKGVFISLHGLENKMEFFESMMYLRRLNLKLYATEGTHRFLTDNRMKVTLVNKIHEKKKPNVVTLIEDGKVDLAINLTDPNTRKDVGDHQLMRRAAIDHNIHILTNRKKAEEFIKAITLKKLPDLKVKAWDEYLTDREHNGTIKQPSI
ncbi:carbamoyl-phosphate synthase (glutamine-hydrolyzing) large subunit [Candidatus Microgenomates bacterium]|nr:carbamoyl-phosphate synthase (glutamine-hydrolyzing) large subunit [Candidatus Microgenomates bacterium]